MSCSNINLAELVVVYLVVVTITHNLTLL